MSRAALVRELDRVTAEDVRSVHEAFIAGGPPPDEARTVAAYCLGVARAFYGPLEPAPTPTGEHPRGQE